jgi:hypothetical protein
MDNTLETPPKKSLSMNSISNYTTENMQKLFKESIQQSDKIIECLDCIRNYYVLSDEMLENIRKMDDTIKMTIIQQYNKMFASLHVIMEIPSPIHNEC